MRPATSDRGRGRIVATVVWVAATFFAAWASVRVLGLERGFPLVAMFAFTPWVALAALISLALALALRRWAAAAVIGIACVAFAALVLPRAIGGGTEVAEDVPLRVLSANMKLGRADSAALARLAGELGADVISVQELTPELAARLDAELRSSHPHSVLVTGGGSSGGGIHSALELQDVPAEPLPGSFALPQASVAISGGPPVVLTSVHTPAADRLHRDGPLGRRPRGAAGRDRRTLANPRG